MEIETNSETAAAPEQERTAGWLYNRSGRVRAVWRLVLYVLLVLFGFAVLGLVIPPSEPHTPEGAFWTGVLYAALCGVAGGAGVLLLRGVDELPASTLGLGLHRRVVIEIGQGLALGIGLLGTIFVVLWGAGWIEVTPPPGPMTSALTVTLSAFLLLALAAAVEELLFRGYAFQVLVQGIGAPATILGTGLLFGLAHSGNPSATLLSGLNTALAGILLAVAYLKVRSLWLPIALHLGWNFAQGVLFGLPVSGLDLPTPLLQSSLTGDGTRLAWLSGGTYGPEGGLVLTVCVLLALLVVWRSSVFHPAEGAKALWVEEEPPHPSS